MKDFSNLNDQLITSGQGQSPLMLIRRSVTLALDALSAAIGLPSKYANAYAKVRMTSYQDGVATDSTPANNQTVADSVLSDTVAVIQASYDAAKATTAGLIDIDVTGSVTNHAAELQCDVYTPQARDDEGELVQVNLATLLSVRPYPFHMCSMNNSDDDDDIPIDMFALENIFGDSTYSVAPIYHPILAYHRWRWPGQFLNDQTVQDIQTSHLYAIYPHGQDWRSVDIDVFCIKGDAPPSALPLYFTRTFRNQKVEYRLSQIIPSLSGISITMASHQNLTFIVGENLIGTRQPYYKVNSGYFPVPEVSTNADLNIICAIPEPFTQGHTVSELTSTGNLRVNMRDALNSVIDSKLMIPSIISDITSLM